MFENMPPALRGSLIAKNGFRNEREIADKFNNWQNDNEAKQWLEIMGYTLDTIQSVNSAVLHGHKTDVHVDIRISVKLKNIDAVENIQVKLVSSVAGFNQIDKRWVDQYAKFWNMPDDIVSIFKRYTGEKEPTVDNPRDGRRMFVDEFSENEQKVLKIWLEDNVIMIIADVIKGRGMITPEWILVAQQTDTNARWTLKPMNVCFNHYSKGGVQITPRGNIRLGRITVQRKGGDAGRETANML